MEPAFGKDQVLEKIGEGGFGGVYKGEAARLVAAWKETRGGAAGLDGLFEDRAQPSAGAT